MTRPTTFGESASASTNGAGLEDPIVIGERPDPATTVVLADDHRLVRAAVRRLLEAEGWIDVVAESADVEETVRKVRGHKPHVLVLDVGMPGGSGLEAIPRLSEASPSTRIVVLTMHRVPELARMALRWGALAFLLKEESGRELIEAVRAALDGQRYLSPGLAAEIAAQSAPSREPLDGLTPRELEVLKLVVRGYTNSEIADQLGVGERTVESHRKHIQDKVCLKSRAQLVSYARGRGLVDY